MDRLHMRRVFEDALSIAQSKYELTEDAIVEAKAKNDEGDSVVVARYKLYTDGRIECFQVLDEVLWPTG